MGTRICLAGTEVWNSWRKYDWNRKGYKNKKLSKMLFFFRFFRLLLFKGRKSLTVKNRIINLIQFEIKYKKVKERKYWK